MPTKLGYACDSVMTIDLCAVYLCRRNVISSKRAGLTMLHKVHFDTKIKPNYTKIKMARRNILTSNLVITSLLGPTKLCRYKRVSL
jgi:hypothetical protein